MNPRRNIGISQLVPGILTSLVLNLGFSATPPGPAGQKPVPNTAMERLADGLKGSLGTRERGDPKAYKRYREAGRKAEKIADLADAERQYSAAAHVAEGFSPKDGRIGESLEAWGRVVSARRKFRQAQRIYEDLTAYRELIHGPDHTSLVGPLLEASEAASYADRFEVAEKSCLRARSIAELRLGAYHHLVGIIWGRLGNVYRMARKDNDAELAFRESLRILQSHKHTLEPEKFALTIYRQRADYSSAAGVMNDLALLYMEQQRYKECETTLKQALAHYEREVGKKSEGAALICHNLGALYRLQKDYAQSESYLTRALALREKLLGPDHLIVADTLANLALLRIDQENPTEAARLNERAQAIRIKAGDRR